MAGFPTNSIIFKYNLKNGNMAVIDTWSKKEFLQVMSDAYKDAHGVRPRGINYSEWSLKELKDEFLMLCQIAADNEQWEIENC